MWAAFAPLAWGPLGWVCLVPLIQLVRLERPTRRMYRLVYVGGLAFGLAALQWMRLGDTWMYPAGSRWQPTLHCTFRVCRTVARPSIAESPLTRCPTVWVG
jgi:apolipoprotein N-acyltransferase